MAAIPKSSFGTALRSSGAATSTLLTNHMSEMRRRSYASKGIRERSEAPVGPASGPRGNPVASSKGTSYFNDALGTTLGFKSNGKYSPAALSAFGEDISAVMEALKIKTVKDLAEKMMSKLSDKEKKALEKWFDDGMWFDALMKADSEQGGASAYECVRPTDSVIDAVIDIKLGKDADYTIVSVKLDSIVPDINDELIGAWFVNGCKFKWKVVYE